jgi:hypothetical protein
MRNAFRTTEGVDLMVDWPIHAGASLAKSLNEDGLPRRRDGFLFALEHHLAVFDPNILN